MSNSRRQLAVFVAVAGLAARTSMAAEPSDSRDATPPSLNTVVVVGERLEQEIAVDNGALGQKKLLDTPFSIAVVSAADIAERQANSIGQIFINDPSFMSSTPSGTTNWWGAQIRGLGVRNYYVDGVPMVLYWGGDFPLEDVESVQALKGLSGFMYGFGAPGGVVSYETKKPADARLTTTELGYRNDGVFYGHVDASGRAGDSDGFGIRVNLAGETGDAYTGAGVNRAFGSIALDYRISDNLLWYGNALYENSDLQHEPLYFYWDLYEGAALPRPTYDYRNVIVDNSYYKTETLNATTGLKWRMSDQWSGNFTIGSSRKQHWSNKMFADLLNEAGDYAGSAYNFTGDLKNTFAQAVVQGSAETGAIRHEFVVGAGFQRTASQWGNDWYWSNDFNGNLYERQGFLVTRDIDFSLAPLTDDARQHAVFASDTLHFGAYWQTLLGLRYTNFEYVDLDHDPEVDSGYKTHALSPTAALIYKPVDSVSIYGSYVEAMEEGSRIGDTYANFGELLEATVSKQYEVGAKIEASRLTFTTAAFRIERAAQIDQLREGLRYLTQDGLTRYDGLEAIADYTINENLLVGLGATYLDAGIEKVSPENADLEGKQPAGAAKWQVVGHTEFTVPSLRALSLHGSVRYFGDAYYEDQNRVLIPHRTLASVGFQYATELNGRPVTITGNVNNLFNEKYWELNQLGEGVNGSLSMKIDW